MSDVSTDVTPGSSATGILDELFALLASERVALRTFDGQAVADFATAKTALAARLAAVPPSELEAVRPRLDALRLELRRNGVLLAHGRACLRDMLAAARAAAKGGAQLRALV